MGSPRFDPAHAVKFDLARGRVEIDGARALVPVDALVELCKAAGEEAAKDFGRRLGTEIGRRVASRLGDGAVGASLEAVVEHLGGELALTGLGSLSLERWGRALLFVVSGSPLGGSGDALIAAVLEGALQRGMGRDASVVSLTRDDAQVRLLVVGAQGAEKARGLLDQGIVWSEVIARLQGGAS